ncbi:MAG: sn-glycerol-3-phosphate import ATP-binding protein UgpC [Firmicutes bacterium]|nr:sn-glycerol-3-phosphate import ATP-binding protein UgpC [Bacillota bacterium]
MNQSHIGIVQLTKYFGKTPVIEGVNCDVRQGEFIVILGPSGCGKSTLLRIIAGLEGVTTGEVYIDGKLVNDVEPKNRDIAMVFQNYALYPHMTVWNNMAYGLKVRGMPKPEIEARVKRATDILGLDGLMNRMPRQLSGGQRQRVAMGRAIVRDPVAFLFDEPLSNLDAQLRVQMRLEIKKLHQLLGTTCIYVTHDQVEAMTLADRLIVMSDGKFMQIGSPLEVYERPENLFVAGFIGSPPMNAVPASLSATGDAVELAGGNVMPLGVRFGRFAGSKVVVGMRPEHISITEGRESTFHITVKMVETLGAETIVYGELTGETTLIIRLAGSLRVALGARLELEIRPEHIHLFDPNSGNRMRGDL